MSEPQDEPTSPVQTTLEALATAAQEMRVEPGNPAIGLTVSLYGQSATVTVGFDEIESEQVDEIIRARMSSAAQQLANRAYQERR